MTLPIKWFLESSINKGYAIQVEETTGYCARIKRGNGYHMLIGADLGLNSASSQRVSSDKAFTNYYLQSDGINTSSTKVITSLEESAVDKENLPFILKPNVGAGGEGVFLVDTEEELEEAFDHVKEISDIVLVQEIVDKPEYRLVVFDERCYFSYQRIHYEIVGDGIKSIQSMIDDRNINFISRRQIEIDDYRLKFFLQKNGLDVDYVPKMGEKLKLFQSANLKCGGVLDHLEGDIDERYIDIAIRCAKSVGLRIAGIDIFADSLEIYDEKYKVIEVNSRPGFEYLRGDEKMLLKLFSDVEAAIFS